MADNERMWAEEQGDVEKAPAGEAGLRSVGISPGGLDQDIQSAEAPVPAEGEAGAAPAAGGASVGAVPAPGAAAAAAPPL